LAACSICRLLMISIAFLMPSFSAFRWYRQY
jgi:hypothetical protein